MKFREKIAAGPVLFDGAMGTYYAQRYGCGPNHCELANLTHPEAVGDIHRAYLRAGCDAVKTNTFGANPVGLDCDEETALAVVEAGWHLACTAASGFDAAVFADIGPIPCEGAEESEAPYYPILDRFLALGAQHFLFETFSTASVLPALCAYIKEKAPDSFILCSFAVMPDGFTRGGILGKRLYEEMCSSEYVDAVGFNCVCGPSHMLKYIQSLPAGGKPLSVMPNAGYPSVVGGRTCFDRNAGYFAEMLAQIAAQGAVILGGCCGSDPEYIEKSRQALQRKPPIPTILVSESKEAPHAGLHPNRFWDKLEQGKKVCAVELDPPVNSDIRAFLTGAQELKHAGADAITIADCPVSRARADSSLLACKLRRELDLDPIPHMTCRDRNLNATKALLLGLNMEEVHNVLIVTGDPVPSAERGEIKSVYNFNAPMLAGFIRDLEPELSNGPFRVFAALNVNAPNFESHLRYAKKKLEHGVAGFLTQPVHSQQALENLKQAHASLSGKILGGVMPIVSYRNACFMNNEISGIRVCDEIADRYKGLDRAQAGDLAVKITTEIAREMAPYVDGYYLITPFMRVDLMTRILKAVK